MANEGAVIDYLLVVGPFSACQPSEVTLGVVEFVHAYSSSMVELCWPRPAYMVSSMTFRRQSPRNFLGLLGSISLHQLNSIILRPSVLMPIH